MIDGTILNQVIKNLGQVAEETGKEVVVQAGKMTESIITGKELVGSIKPLSEQELVKKKVEDEAAVAKAMASLGRNVGEEIDQVRKEKEQTEDEKEKEFLENLKQQREAEEAERQQLNSLNPGRKKRSGPSLPQHKKKSQMPDPSAMSQTNEMTGGKID